PAANPANTRAAVDTWPCANPARAVSVGITANSYAAVANANATTKHSMYPAADMASANSIGRRRSGSRRLAKTSRQDEIDSGIRQFPPDRPQPRTPRRHSLADRPRPVVRREPV